MTKVYFTPYSAVRYIDTKAKEFKGSLARPRPMLKNGDIVIVDKKTAFNLTKKGFDNFTEVTDIEFEQVNIELNIELEKKLTQATAEMKLLKQQLAQANKALKAK